MSEEDKTKDIVNQMEELGYKVVQWMSDKVHLKSPKGCNVLIVRRKHGYALVTGGTPKSDFKQSRMERLKDINEMNAMAEVAKFTIFNNCLTVIATYSGLYDSTMMKSFLESWMMETGQGEPNNSNNVEVQGI